MKLDKFNVDLIEPFVSTQYNDYGGYAAIDGLMGVIDLVKMCHDHGVDEKRYFLVGFTLGEDTTIGVGRGSSLLCTAIVLDSKIYGTSFEEVKDEISKDDGIVKAKKIRFLINYSDLGKYIKRVQIGVVSEISQHISQIEFTEEQTF